MSCEDESIRTLEFAAESYFQHSIFLDFEEERDLSQVSE